MIINKTNWIFSMQVAGILLMAAGWGWVGGNFVPDNQIYLYNALAHLVPILLLLVLTLRFFADAAVPDAGGTHTAWGRVGLSVFAVLSLLGTLILILIGLGSPDPNAIGVKTLPDWFSTIILDLGTLLWLTTLIPSANVRTGSTASHE